MSTVSVITSNARLTWICWALAGQAKLTELDTTGETTKKSISNPSLMMKYVNHVS